MKKCDNKKVRKRQNEHKLSHVSEIILIIRKEMRDGSQPREANTTRSSWKIPVGKNVKFNKSRIRPNGNVISIS